MLKTKCLLILLSFSLCFATSDEESYGNVIVSEITSIYDGDTFRCNIKDFPPLIGNRIAVRINGVDCPELKDKDKVIKEMALAAKQFTVSKLRRAKKIELRNMKRDKYFRILADVYVDGISLGDLLIKENLAKPYDGGKKDEW